MARLRVPTPPGALCRLTPAELARRAQRLAWLLLDVDGVLTDGRLTFGPDGGVSKSFHTKDGFGIGLARRAGLKVGTLSLRDDPALDHRAAELTLDAVVHGRRDKGDTFEQFLRRRRLRPEQVAYAGDDWPDLPVLARCGLSLAPADAAAEVAAQVDVVVAAAGGQGAVREMVELILKARGDWDGLVGGAQ